FKVIGSAQSVRDYRSDAEIKEHQAILEEVDNRMEQAFKGKRKEKQSNAQAPNYTDMINNTLRSSRQ
ncbi:hypothetical protein ACEF08_10280, partial [Streptococcus suis]